MWNTSEKADRYLSYALELHRKRNRKGSYFAGIFLRKALYLYNLYGENEKIRFVKGVLKQGIDPLYERDLS